MNKIEEFMESSVYKNFKMISGIPRNSFKEKKISDFLFNWAKKMGLEVYQDDSLNIFIRKSATCNYEKAPSVLLQAHMDMVCDKAPDSNHDFSTDPIKLYIDGDMISTRGGTTLGADNGIGMAYILSILESKDIPHPKLEALFTTAEEEDMSGAINFDSSNITAKYLINLDHANEKEILCGSCGGAGVKLRLPISRFSLDKSLYKCFRLSIEGLLGGHSGEDIHRGNGNANILLGRVLYNLKELDLKLININGGTFRLAIPRESEAIIAVPLNQVGSLKSLINEMEDILINEYGNTSSKLRISLEERNFNDDSYISQDVLKDLLLLLYATPDGIQEMSNKILGIVDTSCNLGELYIDGDNLIIVYEIRGSTNSKVDYIYEKIELIGQIIGANIELFSPYPEWEYKSNSKLRKIAKDVYIDMFQEEPNMTIVHAGLECGCLIKDRSDLDAISIGPNAWGFHSPGEKVSISSTLKVWEYLKKILYKMNV